MNIIILNIKERILFMKNYCNRRRPNQRNTSQEIKSSQDNTTDELIFPPPSSSNITTYSDYAQGGAYSQEAGYIKEILNENKDIYSLPNQNEENMFFDNMGGQFDFLSIPKERNGLPAKSMSSFLDRDVGKLICLDLWTAENGREELCGVLLETGKNFIAINPHETDNVIMLDLRTIRYVSIYCR